MLPMFDNVCADSEKPNPDCSVAGNGSGGGGTNVWYHFVQFAAFHLDDAIISGGDPACGQPSGMVGCLKGEFVRFVSTGEVSTNPPVGQTPLVTGVQLIK
jgi:hypothetical protein